MLLSKRKKRIAALLTAVVLSVTAAFSLPENIRAEEVTATNSDADAEATTEEGLQEDGIAVQDIGDAGETVYIHSRYWDGWVIADYVNVTATDYTPTLHGALVAKDASGRETEAYCMQSTKSSAKSDTAYKEGRQWLSDRDTAADIALLMFAYGGRRADPNSGDGRNTQDGGTYGTYIIDGKPVMGIMVAGHVYPMTQDEARALTQAAVHSTVSDCDIRAVRGKVSGESVNSAFSHLRSISDNARRWYDQYKDFKVVGNYIDATAAYTPEQTITTQVYNVSKKTWENYNGSELTESYKDSSGDATFRVVYSSSGLCNKLLTNATAGSVTVKHSGSKMTVNNANNYYDYLTISADSTNAVAFTADYGALTSTTQTVKDTFTNTDITQYVFGQTVTIKAKYKDMQGKKLAFTAKTGTGASHTKYYGDGDKNGVSNYAARIFKNTSYQDACFASPNESLSKSASVTATAQGTGSIKIHKYSANPEITDGNSCYSLKGAEFGVFKTNADAQAGQNAVATITTDADGNGSVGNLAYGTYYVKETKASPGYRINNNVYREKVDSDIPVIFDVPEEAGGDPAEVLVQKKDSNGTIFLEGCIFAIKYYDIQMDTDPAQSGKSAVRTWYIKTDEHGYAKLNSGYLQTGSSQMYYNDFGAPTIPVGTITIQEIQAPEGYVLDDTIHTFKITDNPEGIPHINVENDRTISNSRMKQPFELVKLAEGKNNSTYPLAGAGFSACRADQLTCVPENYEAKDGEIIVKDDLGLFYIWNQDRAVTLTADGGTELFTDETGYAKSVPLAYGKYIIRETTVPKNFHPVDPFTVTITENSDEPVKLGYFTDRSFKAYLKLIKKDDATGKKILSDSATFKIWSYDDNDYVSFDGVSEFKTKDGELMTPGTLMPGKYRIEESECPNGYYNRLQNKSYDITIDADAIYKIYETPEGQVTDMGVFEYEIDNTSLHGTIKITKNGEKRIYNETKKEFEISTVKLAGITFKIYADEDILAQDGSGDTIYLKDTLVDTIVTDQDGTAATKELPLGKYRVEEETPVEYVKADPIKVTLAADGQRTKLLNGDGTVTEGILYELTVDNKLKVPEIHTTATDKNGKKVLKADGTVELIDKVYYGNLVPGEYELSGYPVYSNSGEKLTKDGKAVEAGTKFTVTSETGSVDVPYTIDATKLAGRSIVFFEFLYRDGELIAVHADIKDQGQTIIFQPNVPKTGDPVKPIIPIALGIIAAAGIVVMIVLKKKYK